MKKKRRFPIEEIFLFASLFLIVGLVTLWFIDDEIVSAGYAVADCVDNDGDGYYDSGCLLEDLGCPEDEGFVIDSSNQANIDADQNYIVYKDDSSGVWQTYMYEFSSSTSTLLSSSELSLNPRISEPYIVWQGYDSGLWQIYVYSLTSGTSRLLSPGTANQVSPDVSSQWVVWSDFRNLGWDIYGYNLATGTEKAIITDDGDQTKPRIYGNYLTYVDDSAGNQDVYLYDLSTSTKIQVSTNTDKDNAPDVSNSYVVWESIVGDSWDVYVYDIASGDSIALTDSTDDERLPKISEDVIVWMAEDEIYYYDIAQGLSAKITSYDSQKRLPMVYGDIVYWLDYRNENWDIYGKTANVACDLSYFGDCDDEDASVTTCDESEEEVNESCSTDTDCAEGEVCTLGECAVEDVTVDYECAADTDCSSGEYCSGGYCVAYEVDCDSQWDCSNVEWSNCENGLSTRDLSLCNIVPTDDECYSLDYMPESEKECVDDSGVSSVGSTDVPVFTWLNLVLVVGLLVGFYLVKFKRSN